MPECYSDLRFDRCVEAELPMMVASYSVDDVV